MQVFKFASTNFHRQGIYRLSLLIPLSLRRVLVYIYNGQVHVKEFTLLTFFGFLELTSLHLKVEEHSPFVQKYLGHFPRGSEKLDAKFYL